MAKQFKTAGAKPTTENGNRVTRNGRKFQSAGLRFPSFLKPEDFNGQTEYQLISENYQSENLKDDNENVKTFYELSDTQTGEMFIVEQFGHLKYLIEQIPVNFRNMPLYLIIRYKGKQPLKSNPKVSSHLFEVDWANEE
jgi:hypothetical protein